MNRGFDGTLTGSEITHKDAGSMADFVAVHEQVGMEIPLPMDHVGHLSVHSWKALEKHNPAWLEGMVPWQRTELLKEIHEHIEVPLLTGEDIFLATPEWPSVWPRRDT